jgi:hypothetical protein
MTAKSPNLSPIFRRSPFIFRGRSFGSSFDSRSSLVLSRSGGRSSRARQLFLAPKSNLDSVIPLEFLRRSALLSDHGLPPVQSASRVDDEFLARKRDLEPTLPAIRQYLKSIEAEFLWQLDGRLGDICEQRAGARWRMCGSAAIAMAWIIALKSGLPIGNGLDGDHLEIRIGFFNPPGEPQKFEAHAYVRLYSGGKCVYMDPIYGPLMSNDKRIQFAVYDAAEFESGIKTEFSLDSLPLDEKAGRLSMFEMAKTDRGFIGEIHRSMENGMNSIWALFEQAPPTVVQGELFEPQRPDIGQVRDIIKHFVPGLDWNNEPFRPLLSYVLMMTDRELAGLK